MFIYARFFSCLQLKVKSHLCCHRVATKKKLILKAFRKTQLLVLQFPTFASCLHRNRNGALPTRTGQSGNTSWSSPVPLSHRGGTQCFRWQISYLHWEDRNVLQIVRQINPIFPSEPLKKGCCRMYSAWSDVEGLRPPPLAQAVDIPYPAL